MSEHDLSSSDSKQSSHAASPQRRIGRMLPVLALAGALVFILLLALDGFDLVRAAITPPHDPDFTAVGEGPLNQFGYSIESAGDINDDGFDDVIVGANLGGKAYVYAGSASGLSEPAFFTATGTPADQLGFSVAGGGDFNGNGVDDFIVSAAYHNAERGAVFVYHGVSLALPTLVLTLTGETAGDHFGWSVAVIGDVNNDGMDDIAVGAPDFGVNDEGRVYVYHGDSMGIGTTPPTILNGESALAGFGLSVAAAGDVDGDGFDDLAVGAGASEEGGPDAGKAYVFYGSDTGVSQDNNTSVVGDDNDKLGTSVHGAGDVNGDGFDDVMIGVDAFNPGDPSRGRAELYPGGPDGLITTPLYTAIGESDNDHFGFAVAGSGDLNGDGFADFAAGAYDFDAGGPLTDTGKAYAYAGCPNPIAPSLIFSATGDEQSSEYGHTLAIVKDVNNDGVDELVVGDYTAPLAAAGKIFAYYGVNSGGCRPGVELTKTVGLLNVPTIYSNTDVITVPTDAVVYFNYLVRNTGNLSLTQHTIADSVLGIVSETAYSLEPGATFLVSVTRNLSGTVTPGITVTNIATWTAALSITSPSGATNPPNRVISDSAMDLATIIVSGPESDQDGDSIPDNVEGSEDEDQDGLPNYLDPDSDDDGFDDVDEAGPEPTNPLDRDGDGIPGYRDPDENPNTDEPIAGLTIDAPATVFISEPVTLTAIVTAGSNVSYTWDFGDVVTGTGEVVSHTYTITGTYTVTVTATNNQGSSQATHVINVVERPSGEQEITGLVASCQSTAYVNNLATFEASVTGGTSINYTWDFDDGSIGTGNPVSHAFAAARTYEVEVTAGNSLGDSIASCTITVKHGNFMPRLQRANP